MSPGLLYGWLALGFVRPHVLFTLGVMDCIVSTYLLLRYVDFHRLLYYDKYLL